MNIELLRQVKAAIRAEPPLFVMNRYIEPQRCGTACCIAGHAVRLARPELFAYLEDEVVRNGALSVDLQCDGTDVLDIDEEKSMRLFFVGEWPFEFRNRFREADSLEQRAIIAAERIDFFIATGGADKPGEQSHAL